MSKDWTGNNRSAFTTIGAEGHSIVVDVLEAVLKELLKDEI